MYSATGTISRPTAKRSEEHTSELQSHSDLVCRLLLEKTRQKRAMQIERSPPRQTEHFGPDDLAEVEGEEKVGCQTRDRCDHVGRIHGRWHENGQALMP